MFDTFAGAQLAGLACFASSSDDPHLKDDVDSSDSEDEKEAFQIQDTDNLIVIGRVDDDCATLEVNQVSACPFPPAGALPEHESQSKLVRKHR